MYYLFRLSLIGWPVTGAESVTAMAEVANLFSGYWSGRHATTALHWICTKGTINEKLKPFWAALNKLNVYEEFPLGI